MGSEANKRRLINHFLGDEMSVCRLVGRSVRLSVGLSVIISRTGGKFHCHASAPIGALVLSYRTLDTNIDAL